MRAWTASPSWAGAVSRKRAFDTNATRRSRPVAAASTRTSAMAASRRAGVDR
ncbi:MAG TPA: hypothetical protein VIL36_20690 [Acidimicrobiales bacterium]